MKSLLNALCGAAVLGLWITNTANAATPPTLKLQDHPLVGTVWDVKQERQIDTQDLNNKLDKAFHVLLGEKHDNISHHRHQAWVIRQLASRHDRVGVAFEMIDTAQAENLTREQRNDPEKLIEALSASSGGWPYGSMYRPLFEAVVQSEFSIVAANLPSRQIRQLAGRAEAAVPAHLQTILKASPLSERQSKDLSEEIQRAHCDMLGEAMLPAMSRVQRVRDAMMTHALTSQADEYETMVLIAGAGHVRSDRGVPFYLRQQTPRRPILTIGWIEVKEDASSLKDYTERWQTEQLPFDIVWFTPRAEREDPCEALRKRFRHRQQ